ncbi:MAG TPA: histidine kinase dimerization/phosphoacceptor domain-containing protein, partial [Candidatus Acidoferrales bacterium]|nr:histidine kinase dimerization/phosphoacceptor domain-containing protein [Candidatus Acidoferrales bacterium]
MQPHAAERRHLERLITFARPIFVVLALVDLLELSSPQQSKRAVVFVFAYLSAALALAMLGSFRRGGELRIPLAVDLAVLAAFLVLTPSVVAFWFLFLFVEFAAGIRWGLRRSITQAGLVTLALLVRTAIRGPVNWPVIISWVALVAGTFAAGVGLAFLGDRLRRHGAEQEFLAKLTSLLQVDQGVAESLRLALHELARIFACGQASLVFRDADLERLFVWRVRTGDGARISPQSLALSRGEGYLLDNPDASVCWNDLEGVGEGFGWNRRDGRRLAEVPRLAGPVCKEMDWRSVLTATFEFGGQPVGRIFLANGKSNFSPLDLRWLERIVRHVGPQLENLFLLRHLRARAIDAERSRISRDLHDGILQTLLSVEIQLDVLRRKVAHAPEQAANGLAALQQTVRNETDELRRMVTDLRPLRVVSADMVDLMRGFAERFRNEAGFALDVLIDSAELQVPDRIC